MVGELRNTKIGLGAFSEEREIGGHFSEESRVQGSGVEM